MIGVTRLTVTVPAAGSTDTYKIEGFQVVTEKSPDDTVAGVPLLRFVAPSGNALPAYSGSHYTFKDGFTRFYVEGTTESAGSEISLLVVTTEGLTISFPGTVE